MIGVCERVARPGRSEIDWRAEDELNIELYVCYYMCRGMEVISVPLVPVAQPTTTI